MISIRPHSVLGTEKNVGDFVTTLQLFKALQCGELGVKMENKKREEHAKPCYVAQSVQKIVTEDGR